MLRPRRHRLGPSLRRALHIVAAGIGAPHGRCGALLVPAEAGWAGRAAALLFRHRPRRRLRWRRARPRGCRGGVGRLAGRGCFHGSVRGRGARSRPPRERSQARPVSLREVLVHTWWRSTPGTTATPTCCASGSTARWASSSRGRVKAEGYSRPIAPRPPRRLELGVGTALWCRPGGTIRLGRRPRSQGDRDGLGSATRVFERDCRTVARPQLVNQRR